MQHADVNLYIVRHNYSKTSALNVINNLYHQKQVENIHIIINDFKHTSSGYGMVWLWVRIFRIWLL